MKNSTQKEKCDSRGWWISALFNRPLLLFSIDNACHFLFPFCIEFQNTLFFSCFVDVIERYSFNITSVEAVLWPLCKLENKWEVEMKCQQGSRVYHVLVTCCQTLFLLWTWIHFIYWSEIVYKFYQCVLYPTSICIHILWANAYKESVIL